MTMVTIDTNKEAYRLINPGCVVIISVGDKEMDNLFTVTWNMPLRKEPAMLAIESGKSHYSYPFIEKTGEFGINIMHADHADALYGCGTTSGKSGVDKFEKFKLNREKAEKIKAPLIAEAIGTLECRVCQVVDLGASALLIAQVLAAKADDRYFTKGMWHFNGKLKLLHHLSGNKFCISDKILEIRKDPPFTLTV